jgi:hypothetical protein
VRPALRFLPPLLLLLASVPAYAQPASDQRPERRFEIAAGGGWFSGGAFGSGDANLRARDGTEYLLFSTTSRFTGGALLEARVGFVLTRRYVVEGRIGMSRPDLRTSVSADVEGAPALTVSERVDQYAIDGALLVMLDRFRLGGVIPFASGGAGYLRQLHEGLTLIEEGAVVHLGGGAKHWLFVHRDGVVKAVGIRGDARVYLLIGGVRQDDRPRPHGAVSGSVFVTF